MQIEVGGNAMALAYVRDQLTQFGTTQRNLRVIEWRNTVFNARIEMQTHAAVRIERIRKAAE